MRGKAYVRFKYKVNCNKSSSSNVEHSPLQHCPKCQLHLRPFILLQDIESIELRRGLVYHMDRAIVEMSEALPVEDRLVVFDAVRLPEPRQLDHHCVRYEGANVSPLPDLYLVG